MWIRTPPTLSTGPPSPILPQPKLQKLLIQLKTVTPVAALTEQCLNSPQSLIKVSLNYYFVNSLSFGFIFTWLLFSTRQEFSPSYSFLFSFNLGIFIVHLLGICSFSKSANVQFNVFCQQPRIPIVIF